MGRKPWASSLLLVSRNAFLDLRFVLRNAILIEATTVTDATEVYIVIGEWRIGKNEVELTVDIDAQATIDCGAMLLNELDRLDEQLRQTQRQRIDLWAQK
jgi:hypothetical protein